MTWLKEIASQAAELMKMSFFELRTLWLGYSGSNRDQDWIDAFLHLSWYFGV